MASEWWRLGDDPWSRADWLSLAQVVLTTAGFIAAIVQLSRTIGVTRETNRRLKNLQKQFTGTDLLVALPELHRIEDEMDAAIKKPDEDEAERCLVRYARKASQVIAMVDADADPDDKHLASTLSAARKAVTKARTDLVKGGSTLSDVAPSAIAKMVAASAEVSAAIARRQRKLDTSDDK